MPSAAVPTIGTPQGINATGPTDSLGRAQISDKTSGRRGFYSLKRLSLYIAYIVFPHGPILSVTYRSMNNHHHHHHHHCMPSEEAHSINLAVIRTMPGIVPAGKVREGVVVQSRGSRKKANAISLLVEHDGKSFHDLWNGCSK